MHERESSDDLLLLACDGLWDVMTTDEAVMQVRELYETGEKSVVKIAEEMLDVSLNKGEGGVGYIVLLLLLCCTVLILYLKYLNIILIYMHII